MSEPTSGHPELTSGRPVNEVRAAIYRRLMEAQEQIAFALYKRGVDNAIIQDALDAADERLTDDERQEDLYLSALGHYVAALGGRVEVRAVVGDDAVIVHRAPVD